jgi:hypothetical protein
MNERMSTRGDNLSAAGELGHVEARVRSRLAGRVRELRVEACADGLVLEGWTATYYAKQLAQHAVMEVTRLPIVRNGIEVR